MINDKQLAEKSGQEFSYSVASRKDLSGLSYQKHHSSFFSVPAIVSHKLSDDQSEMLLSQITDGSFLFKASKALYLFNFSNLDHLLK